MQLKEEKKTANRLREVSEKKNEQVNIVDAEITAEMERFRWKREEALFLMRTSEEESKARVKAMKEQEKEILQQIADFDLQTNENQKLTARLKALSLEYRTTTKNQLEERNSRTKKNFETRMAMEEIMRKMVRNVDSSYEHDAVRFTLSLRCLTLPILIIWRDRNRSLKCRKRPIKPMLKMIKSIENSTFGRPKQRR